MNCCLDYMTLRGGADSTPARSQTPSGCCFTTRETEAWFICSQIKAAEVERVEKIIPGDQEGEKKTLKLSINNNEESVIYESYLEAQRHTED